MDIPAPPTAVAPPLERLLAVTANPLQLFTGNFLFLALVFFILALVAALVGSRGVAGVSMEIARIFIVIFLVLAIISLIL